ncbi:hypothetical protein ACTFIU_005678, partial [Dictyostelium citrinum]
LVFKKEKF